MRYGSLVVTPPVGRRIHYGTSTTDYRSRSSRHITRCVSFYKGVNMFDQSELTSLVDDIDNHGVGLTDWETEFIDSILKQIDEGRELTEKQEKTIRKIYEDRVSV